MVRKLSFCDIKWRKEVVGGIFDCRTIPLRIGNVARCWWLTPVILATQEAEIRGFEVQS
jgi:hypothetical protein